MYKTILVPVEPSHVEKHQDALDMALALAEDGARIVALTVIEPVPGYFALAESLPTIQQQAGESTLKDLKAFVGDRANIETHVMHGHAASEILVFAEREDVDCIVIASHRPGLVDYFLGSTAARVVRHAPCSVHVMR